MPLVRCQEDGKPGWVYGKDVNPDEQAGGKCYTYTKGDKTSEAAAKLKAIKQGLASSRSQGVKPDFTEL